MLTIPRRQSRKIIVAGMPRSGTTLVWRAIAQLSPGDTTPPDYQGPVKKTHNLAPNRLPPGYKAVFLFGDPIAAVISTRLKRYDRKHFDNCGAHDRDPETTDIYKEDALGYEAIFDSWYRPNGYPVMCVKFERLYSSLQYLDKFLGFRVRLPLYRPRTTTYDVVTAAELNSIRKTYAPLIQKVAEAPDLAVFA